MTFHLSPKFWLYSVLGVVGLVSTISGAAGWIVVAAPFLLVIAVSVADGWWPTATVLDPELSTVRAIEGDQVMFTFTVATSRRVSLASVEVQLAAILEPIGPTRFVGSIDGQRDYQVLFRCSRWGVATPEWVTLSLKDVFGLSETLVRVPVQIPLSIHPPTETLKSMIPLTRDRPVTGEHRSRARGGGTELAEVREYRTGDPYRSISPRLSARRGKPMVVERHPERASDIVLFVDSSQDLGVELNTSLRFTITASMSLATRHLRGQDRVGVIDLGFGVRWLPPRLGRRHLHRIVSALLSTQALQKDTHPTTTVPLSAVPSTATVVAITPLLSPAVMTSLVQLRSRGQEIVVIEAPIAPSYPGSDPLAERIFRAGRQLNRNWLSENGVTIVPWTVGESIEPVIRRVAVLHRGVRR